MEKKIRGEQITLEKIIFKAFTIHVGFLEFTHTKK